MPMPSQPLAAPAGSGTCSSVYVSRATVSHGTVLDLGAIEEQARAHNAAKGIRGVLLHLNGYFLQWLEGPANHVEPLLRRIREDPRHHAFELLIHDNAAPVLSDDWVMHTLERRESVESTAARVEELVSAAKRDAWSPMDVLRRFCAPGAVRKSLDREGNFLVSRITLIANNAMWPAALIKHVAELDSASVGRTRFLGGSNSGEGVLQEYVDLPFGARHHIRLTSMGGDVLRSPIRELFLQDLDVLAFLVRAGATGAAAEVMQRALNHPAIKQRRPMIIGVFAHAASEAADLLLEGARTHGYDCRTTFAHLAEPSQVWSEINALVLQQRDRPRRADNFEVAGIGPVSHDDAYRETQSSFVPHLSGLRAIVEQVLNERQEVDQWVLCELPDLHQLASRQQPGRKSARLPDADTIRAVLSLAERLQENGAIDMIERDADGCLLGGSLLDFQGKPYWVQICLQSPSSNLGLAKFIAAQLRSALQAAQIKPV